MRDYNKYASEAANKWLCRRIKHLLPGIDHSVFAEPIPYAWIWGCTILASLLCTIAMAADLLRSFKRLKFWLTPNFFALNALVITLLGVAAKVPDDPDIPGILNQILKLGGMMYITIGMNHSMPSLGLMRCGAILANTAALGIVVVSIASYIWFQILRFHANSMTMFGAWITASYTLVMLFTYFTLVSYALSATSLRRRLETKYRSKHEAILREADEECSRATGARPIISIETLNICLERYWLMASSSGPDMILLSSGTYAAASLLHGILFLAFTSVFSFQFTLKKCYKDFDYSRTVGALLHIQLVSSIVGSFMILLRVFSALGVSRLQTAEMLDVRRLLYVEGYKLQPMEEWKERPLPFQVKSRRAMAAALRARGLALDLLVLFQRLVAFLTRLLLLITSYVIAVVLGVLVVVKLLVKSAVDLCCCCRVSPSHAKDAFGSYFKVWKKKKKNNKSDDSDKEYILLPEGGNYITLHEPKDWVRRAKKKKPQHLLELLKKHNTRFIKRVSRASGSTSDHLCHTWSLRLATLQCIVHVASRATINRGGDWVKLTDTIDRCFSYSLIVDSLHIRAATEAPGARKLLESIAGHLNCTDVGVAVCEKEVDAAKVVRRTLMAADRWLDVGLGKLARSKDAKDAVQKLRGKATECWEKCKDLDRNEWPLAAFAAESMREVAGSLLGGPGFGYGELEAEVAVTMGTCLRVLPLAILYECSNGRYGLRETHVQLAATVLGETEEILKFFDTEKVQPGLKLLNCQKVDYTLVAAYKGKKWNTNP